MKRVKDIHLLGKKFRNLFQMILLHFLIQITNLLIMLILRIISPKHFCHLKLYKNVFIFCLFSIKHDLDIDQSNIIAHKLQNDLNTQRVHMTEIQRIYLNLSDSERRLVSFEVIYFVKILIHYMKIDRQNQKKR